MRWRAGLHRPHGARRGGPRATARASASIVGAALAPDLDLLLRFVDGRNHHKREPQPRLRARWRACRLAACAGCGASAAAGARLWPLALGPGSATSCLDYLDRDTHPPIGIMALWPFAQGYYKFPWPLFLDIGRTLNWDDGSHNALAAAWEVAVLGPDRASAVAPAGAVDARGMTWHEASRASRWRTSRRAGPRSAQGPRGAERRRRWPPGNGALELARADVLRRIELARAEPHREMLRRALAALEADLAKLTPPPS